VGRSEQEEDCGWRKKHTQAGDEREGRSEQEEDQGWRGKHAQAGNKKAGRGEQKADLGWRESTHFLEMRRQVEASEKTMYAWATKGKHSLPENEQNWPQSVYLSFEV
jgi:hypothetical protein